VKSRQTTFRDILVEQRILILIVAITFYLSMQSRYFFTFQNIINILLAISYEGMIAIGMAMLIILGEIDLSVGSMMAFGSVLAILFQPFGIGVAIFAGIAGGTLIGLLNGILVTKFKIPSIAATLGTMIFVKGLVYALTNEHTITGSNKSFLVLSEIQFMRIPLSVILFFFLVLLFETIMRKTFFGRNIYAVGGNATASRFFGINVDRTKLLCFVITGFLAGLAGVMLAGKLNIASGNIGQYSNVLIITAVLLGGISMDGGEGNIVHAFQGMLLIGIMNNAMVILRISSFVQEIIRGGLLILIIVINAINIQKKKYS
jgi:ribose transport system permease protein